MQNEPGIAFKQWEFLYFEKTKQSEETWRILLESGLFVLFSLSLAHEVTDNFDPYSDTVKQLIREGIPPKYRIKVI